MPAILVNQVRSTLGVTDHPYMTGAWTPNFDEYDATGLEVIGEIPRDLDGVYVRNTENRCTRRSASTTRSTATG